MITLGNTTTTTNRRENLGWRLSDFDFKNKRDRVFDGMELKEETIIELQVAEVVDAVDLFLNSVL